MLKTALGEAPADAGFVMPPTLSDEEMDARDREYLRRQKAEALLEASGIPPRYKLEGGMTVLAEDDENRTALKVVRAYVARFTELDGQGKGLYFVGPQGRGKTAIACAACMELIERGVYVRYTSFLDLLAEMRDTFNRKESEQDVIRRCEKAHLLVLDDLGKESPSEWSLAMLYRLVNHRYENLLPTLVTTQYDDADLVGRLAGKGDERSARAIVSRLHESCYRVDVQGRDRRKATA